MTSTRLCVAIPDPEWSPLDHAHHRLQDHDRGTVLRADAGHGNWGMNQTTVSESKGWIMSMSEETQIQVTESRSPLWHQNMPKPEVSFFIPAYNADAFLFESMSSVLAQYGCAFELLVIDDCSQDNTSEIAKQFLRNDPRVRYVHLGKNRGVAFASNMAIEKAAGNYLLRLDADDRAMPGRLQAQHDALKSGLYDVVGGDIKLFGDQSGEVNYPRDAAAIKALFLAGMGNIANPASGFNLSFVREHRLRYNESLVLAEDLNFWIDAMAAGARFYTVPQVVTAYRIHAQQSEKYKLHLEKAQLFTRSKLLDLWYPQMNAGDKSCLHCIMLNNAQKNEVLTALAEIPRIIASLEPSAYGESLAVVQRWLRGRIQLWEKALALGS